MLSAEGDPDVVRGWFRRARAGPSRVVLADGSDPRVVEAAAELTRHTLIEPVILNDPAHGRSDAVQAAAAASRWAERIDLDDPLHVAALMVAAGDVDACVAGATRTTADVVRAALYCIGPAPGVGLISSSFVMVLADGTPLVFTDCGVVPEPDAEQLASIAIAGAHTYRQLVGDEPRVALLSYSTLGSADGSSPQRVREAVDILAHKAPGLAVDGELQFDAAWDGAVAKSKAPGSPVAGRANVFVFPNLDAGNLAYKITERLGGAIALGPLLQGAAGVIHDLSRGADAQAIALVSVIAACQAQQ